MEQSSLSDVSLPAHTGRGVGGRGQAPQRARGRGRSRRGRRGGQGNAAAISLTQDDARRVLDLQSRRIAYEQVCVELCLGKIDT